MAETGLRETWTECEPDTMKLPNHRLFEGAGNTPIVVRRFDYMTAKRIF